MESVFQIIKAIVCPSRINTDNPIPLFFIDIKLNFRGIVIVKIKHKYLLLV